MNKINGFKVELIPVFITILDTLSVTASAKKLGLTQSAVSHSLKKLREQLDDDIVFREGNRLVATAKAEKIYPVLKRWYGELDSIIDATEFDPRMSRKNFYIATTDIVEQMFLPDLISHLKVCAPEIGIRMVRWQSDLFYSQLMNAEINLAVGVRNYDYPNLMQKALYKETFHSAARSGHPIFETPINLERFLSYPHAMTSSGDRQKGVVDIALERLNRERLLLHTVSNFSSAPYIVENSDCILTAPSRFLRICAKKHKLEAFKPPIKLPEFDVKLFWSKKMHKDRANQWLRNVISDVFIATANRI